MKNTTKLTNTEIQILKICAEGYSIKQAADKLQISTAKLKTIAGNAMEKLETNKFLSALIRANLLDII